MKVLEEDFLIVGKEFLDRQYYTNSFSCLRFAERTVTRVLS
jgi:hypothetical protein